MDNNTPQPDIVNETDVKIIDTENEQIIEEAPKKERRKLSYYFTGSIIISWLGMLTEAIYGALVDGFFGKIFTSYSQEEHAFVEGHLKKSVIGNSKIKNGLRNTRRVFAEGFENSFFLGFFKKIIGELLATSLKNYGNFLLSFGLYTVFVFFVKRFVVFAENSTLVDFLTGIVLIVVALPILASKISLAEALGDSTSARALLSEVFGMRDESFDVPVKQSKLRANLSIILGMAAGILTFVIAPVYIVLLALGIIGVSMIMVTPEIGIVVSLFSLPFLSFGATPSLMLAAIVLVSAAGYTVKVIRGKRIIKFEIIDVAVLLFSIIVFFAGAFSAGGAASLFEGILACTLISVYFLITNMMRTRKWIDRCVISLVSSAAVCAVLGVVEYFFGDISTQWLDTTYFEDIRGRVVSLFDNSNVLAFYLVIIFPFALDLIFKGRTRGEKFLAIFSSAAIALCTVFTWSRGAWLGLIACTLVYLLIKTRIVIKAFFGICVLLPVIPVVIPSNIIKRFMSIGDISDSSTYYRVLTWRGSFRAAFDSFFGGYGYGTSAFENVYPMYAIAGIEASEHTHSLYLGILFAMGFVGFIVFLLVAFLFSQKALEFLAKREDNENACVPAAAFAAFVAALVMGLFDNIWYNSRVMFLFFAVMGIACAAIRISDELFARKRVEVYCDETSAYIDI